MAAMSASHVHGAERLSIPSRYRPRPPTPYSWIPGSCHRQHHAEPHTVPNDVSGTIAVDGPFVRRSRRSLLTERRTHVFSHSRAADLAGRALNGMSGQVFLACDVNVSILKPDGITRAGDAWRGAALSNRYRTDDWHAHDRRRSRRQPLGA